MKLHIPRLNGRLALIALCAGILVAMIAWTSGAEPQADGETTLQVVGTADETAEPDMAVIHTAVEARGKTPLEAQHSVEELYGRVKAGAATSRLQLTPGHYSLLPRYEYREGEEPKLIGYEATRQLEVRVHDVDRVGAAIEVLLTSGVETIRNVEFGVSDTEALRARAVRAALDDAERQARVVATHLGKTVKGPATISLGNQSPQPIVTTMKAESRQAFEPSPVEAKAHVQVTYILE